MKLYVCRHAIAVDAGEKMQDADRPLSREGVRKFEKGAAGFAEVVKGVTHVLTSPALRARQTAEILVEALAREKVGADVIVARALGTGGKLEAVLKQVRALEGAKDVVVVGHEPMLSAWVGAMCGGVKVEMKKGAVAVVELEGRGVKGELVGLWGPKILRGLR